MPRTRFSMDDSGNLVDKHGRVLGKVVAITLDLPAEGGKGGPISVVDSPPNEKEPPLPPNIAAVWDCYVEVMSPRRATLDPGERTIIREALKVASAEECCKCIRMCRASDFHMGKNDKRRKYNTLSKILKGRRGKETTRERIDWWLEKAEETGAPVTSDDQVKVDRAKRRVLAAHELPGSAQAQTEGKEARQWLESRGHTIEQELGGRPFFLDP